MTVESEVNRLKILKYQRCFLRIYLVSSAKPTKREDFREATIQHDLTRFRIKPFYTT